MQTPTNATDHAISGGNGHRLRDRITTRTEEWLAPENLAPRPDVETTQKREPGQALTQGLGWFSVGLGLTQLLAPGFLGRLIGVKSKRDSATLHTIMRLCGARELTTGLGLLNGKHPERWLEARLAGDALDVALLGLVLGSGHARGRLSAAALAVAGVSALDALALKQVIDGRAQAAPDQVASKATHVGKAITIGVSPDVLYAYWRDLTNLPRFMEHLQSVEVLDERRSKWTARGPAGIKATWEAEIIEGSRVWNSGSVRFLKAPGERGTELVVELHYRPPGGALGQAVASIFGMAPSLQISKSLRRMKQLIELGEVVASDASIHAGPHPAQPSGKKPEGGAR
jgi:uncharacterized membrane protein